MSQRRIDPINKIAQHELRIVEENASGQANRSKASAQDQANPAAIFLVSEGYRVAKSLSSWRRTKRSASRRFNNTGSDDFEILDNDNEPNHDVDLGALIAQVQVQAQNEQQHEQQQKNDQSSHRHAAENAMADIEWARINDHALEEEKSKAAAALTYPTKYLLDVLNNLRDRLLRTPRDIALAPMIWQAMREQIDILSANLPPASLRSVRRQLIDHTTPSPADAPSAVRTYHLLLPLILLQATCPRPKSHIRRAHALLDTMQIATEINTAEVRKCTSSFAS